VYGPVRARAGGPDAALPCVCACGPGQRPGQSLLGCGSAGACQRGRRRTAPGAQRARGARAGQLGAVFRTVLETTRTLFVWLVDLLLFYTPLGMGSLGESWSTYSLIQAAGRAPPACPAPKSRPPLSSSTARHGLAVHLCGRSNWRARAAQGARAARPAEQPPRGGRLHAWRLCRALERATRLAARHRLPRLV